MAAELRTERGNRLSASSPPRRLVRRAFTLALHGWALTSAPGGDGKLEPGLTDRQRWARAWALRRACGKALNALRLAKAAFTFEGGADYLAWKIERHSGVHWNWPTGSAATRCSPRRAAVATATRRGAVR
jgi:hypothetical protein